MLRLSGLSERWPPVTTHRIIVALRAVFYASGFVFLWAWLAVSVQPLDSELAFAVPPCSDPLVWWLASRER